MKRFDYRRDKKKTPKGFTKLGPKKRRIRKLVDLTKAPSYEVLREPDA